MSEKDARMLDQDPKVKIIENGVDLDRFRPEPEPEGRRLLFIGSFRHFPNIEALPDGPGSARSMSPRP